MLNFHVYDVFTERAYAGNPLAIVEGADGLSGAQMQAIAAEFNLSETIFLMPPADPAHTARVRIFTPDHEMPFAGHPTVGCAVYLATRGREGAFETTITLEEEAGLVPVTVSRHAGAAVVAEFTAPVTPEARDLDLADGEVAAALGVATTQLGPHRAHVMHGGHPFVHICLRDRAALAQASPRGEAFEHLARRCGTGSVYVYCPGDTEGGADYEARMFAPLGGIAEDPATGSATALLAGQLLQNGAIRDGTTRLRICQGRDMGRESWLHLSVDITEGAIAAIRVAGSAVAVSRGQIAPPE